MLPVPIEVVDIRPAVIRDLALRPRPEPVEEPPTAGPPTADLPSAGPAGPRPDAAFSDCQRRELVELMEALQCEVRQRALETLAPGDSVPVGQLARRMGVAQPTVSNHLNILRRMGLVRAHRVGRCIEYQAAPGLVRLEQHSGKLTHTVSRPSGATVTLGATMPINAETPKAEEATNDERSG